MIKKKLFCVPSLAALLFNLCVISCSSDGDNSSSSKPAAQELQITSPIEVENYDFADMDTILEVKSYPYEIKFTVPVQDDETWEANLEFDPTDYEVEGDPCYELGSLNKKNGTGKGTFSLYVYENGSTKSHKATLSISSASLNKTINLLQYPPATNDGEEVISVKNARSRMIGYGYDYTAGYASESCVRYQVLDVAKLCGEEGITIDYGKKLGEYTYRIDFTNFSNTVDYRELSGANTAEIEVKLAAELSGELEIGGFSAEINNHTEWQNKEDIKYQYGWTDISVSKYTASTEINSEDICRHEFLNPQAYQAINGLTAKYATNYIDNDKHSGIYHLIKDYGSYVVVGGKLGGVANVTMQVDESAVSGAFNTEAMLKLAYDGFLTSKSEVQADYKKSYTDNSSKFKFHSIVRGGSEESQNELTSLLGNISATVNDRGTVATTWKNSLSSVNNCVFLGFTNSKKELIPIYEFVDTELKGGEERRQAIVEYFKTQMLIDFPEAASQGVNVKTTPSKIPLPKIDDNYQLGGILKVRGRIENYSLIHDIKLNDGVMAVRACSEYIPEIDTSKRITVLYPADNNRVYWNRGLYFGDEDHPPYSISWVNEKLVCNPKKGTQDKKTGKYIAPTTVYRFGTVLTFTEPTYLTKDYVIVDAKPAEQYKEYLGGKWRPLVKIGDCIFQRDYWDYDNFNDGTSIATVAKAEANWRNHADQNNIPIRNWVQTVTGQTVNTSKNDHKISGDGVYYPVSMYRYHLNDYGGLFPSGWRLPYGTWTDKLVARLEKITNKTGMGGNVAGAFLNPDLLGLKIYKYGYISFWNGNGSSCWYQEAYNNHATFPVVYDFEDKGPDYETTGWGVLRLVITDDSVSRVAHNLNCARADEKQKTNGDGNFVSRRGPCFNILLCKPIY